jgi:hypothetical protein
MNDLSACHFGVGINRVLFGFTTGILVELVLILRNDKGSSMGTCSLEVTLEHKDYTLSELKAAATDEAFKVLETMLSKRHDIS